MSSGVKRSHDIMNGAVLANGGAAANGGHEASSLPQECTISDYM